MSSKTSPAPWRDLFLKHVAQMPQATFTLSTIDHPTRTPRGRTCIYRGLWAELTPNPKNPAPLNPPQFASDLPTFTTDIRMAKAADLAPPGDEDHAGQGEAEAMFWVEQTQTQWRVRGRVYLLGGEDGVPAAAREVIQKRMRPSTGSTGGKDERRTEEWDWAREVTAHFGNLSPGMRGSFRNPPPGTPRAIPGGEGEGLGQKVEDVEDELARRNFRVGVLVPREIDLVDLADPQDQRRWIYRYVGEGSDDDGKVVTEKGWKGSQRQGDWETCEMWP